MSLDSYRARVELLARNRAGDPIYNGSTEHAVIVVEAMFAHARKRMRILSGKLNARVYSPDEVIGQARLFLADPSHQVQILLEDDSALKDNPFYEEFSDQENVKFKKVPEDFQVLYDFHVLVMDDDSYRFESDKTEHAAIAAFGDKDGAMNLGGMYDYLWNNSEELRAT